MNRLESLDHYRVRLPHALDRVRQVVVPIGASPLRHYLRQEPSAGNPHAGICAGGRSQERSLPAITRAWSLALESARRLHPELTLNA